MIVLVVLSVLNALKEQAKIDRLDCVNVKLDTLMLPLDSAKDARTAAVLFATQMMPTSRRVSTA